MRSLTTAVIIGAVVLVVAVGLLMRSEAPPASEHAPAPNPARRLEGASRPARVEERLQRLREGRETREAGTSSSRRRRSASNRPREARETREAGTAGQQGGIRAPRRLSPRLADRVILPPATSLSPGEEGDEGFDEDIAKLRDTIQNDPNPEERASAVFFLSGEDEKVVIPVLVDALNDPDAEVRLAVVEALGDYSDEITPDIVLPALNDPDPEVRFEALGVLGDMEGPAAHEAAQRMLNDPNDDVRDLAHGILEMNSDS